MEILILNGSPRANGDTKALIKAFQNAMLRAAARKNQTLCFTQLDAYRLNIQPCTDCRACRTLGRCCFSDDMQSVHEALLRCDAIVLASPLFYGELTGRLLDLASRFQVYYLGGKSLKTQRRQHWKNCVQAADTLLPQNQNTLLTFSQRAIGAAYLSGDKARPSAALGNLPAALLLCGGGNGGPDAALRTARIICRSLHASLVGTAMSLQTDKLPVCEDKELPAQLEALAEALFSQIG